MMEAYSNGRSISLLIREKGVYLNLGGRPSNGDPLSVSIYGTPCLIKVVDVMEGEMQTGKVQVSSISFADPNFAYGSIQMSPAEAKGIVDEIFEAIIEGVRSRANREDPSERFGLTRITSSAWKQAGEDGHFHFITPLFSGFEHPEEHYTPLRVGDVCERSSVGRYSFGRPVFCLRAGAAGRHYLHNGEFCNYTRNLPDTLDPSSMEEIMPRLDFARSYIQGLIGV